uniref:Cytochrome P450 monooxygenase n=1 Tax=Lagerstroemia speciosa TaxID=122810 RepID=A0A451F5H5_LAGSP|nr:cytochrome P450 monooxygenase [Lagerstroemia speciosa]
MGMLIFLLALALLWTSCRVLNWVWLRPKRVERFLRRQGLSGSSYKFLSGDIKESMKMLTGTTSRPIGLYDDILPRVFPFEHQILNSYGKDSFWWTGTSPRVFLMHPEQLKDIFSKIYDFQKLNSPLGKLLVRGVVTYDGDKWAMHRKIINPAFHIEKLKLMLPAFHSTCMEMVTGWEKLMGAQESIELDVWTDLQSLTRDVISRTAFGSSYKEGRRLFDLQIELTDLLGKSRQKVYIPGWRFIPTKTNRRMKAIHYEVQSLVREMIEKRQKAMKAGKPASDDLLGLMLESNTREIRENHGKKNGKVGMSIQDVIEECRLFYLAGQETTSSLLAWAMVLLSIHPQWQDRAREEVLQVFGRDQLPGFDGLNHLKIIMMILYEVLRLYPPVPLMSRTVHKTTKLGKLDIPAGTQLQLPVIFIHHDKGLWGEDAKEFKPERFSEGISKATGNQIVFFPFGWGPRICVGQNFALIEVKMAMAMILQRFAFELSPSYAHAPILTISLQPQHGVQVILRRC